MRPIVILGAVVAGTAMASAAEPVEFEQLQLVLLKRAPDAPKLSDEESASIQKQHLAHLEKMASSKKLVLAGPFGNQDDAGLRGLCLYRVATPAEARSLAEQDPAIKAGRLVAEVMTLYVEKGAVTFPMVEGAGK